MSAQGTRCGVHAIELEEVRPGKWLCPEPECMHIVTDGLIERMREFFWAQEHGMVHPEAMEIPGGPAAPAV